MSAILTPAERRPRAELIRLADGYFNTLQHNDGTIKTGLLGGGIVPQEVLDGVKPG